MKDTDQRTLVTPMNCVMCIRQQRSAYASAPLSICPKFILELICYFPLEGAHKVLIITIIRKLLNGP